jgi:hypothetical protein
MINNTFKPLNVATRNVLGNTNAQKMNNCDVVKPGQLCVKKPQEQYTENKSKIETKNNDQEKLDQYDDFALEEKVYRYSTKYNATEYQQKQIKNNYSFLHLMHKKKRNEEGLTDAQYEVLKFINWCNMVGIYCHLSQSKIAKLLKLSRKTVNKAIAELTAINYITKTLNGKRVYEKYYMYSLNHKLINDILRNKGRVYKEQWYENDGVTPKKNEGLHTINNNKFKKLNGGIAPKIEYKNDLEKWIDPTNRSPENVKRVTDHVKKVTGKRKPYAYIINLMDVLLKKDKASKVVSMWTFAQYMKRILGLIRVEKYVIEWSYKTKAAYYAAKAKLNLKDRLNKVTYQSIKENISMVAKGTYEHADSFFKNLTLAIEKISDNPHGVVASLFKHMKVNFNPAEPKRLEITVDNAGAHTALEQRHSQAISFAVAREGFNSYDLVHIK